jgi:hypothetical protein
MSVDPGFFAEAFKRLSSPKDLLVPDGVESAMGPPEAQAERRWAGLQPPRD